MRTDDEQHPLPSSLRLALGELLCEAYPGGKKSHLRPKAHEIRTAPAGLGLAKASPSRLYSRLNNFIVLPKGL